ncbi:IS1 family transposase [Salinibacter ruber]|uniref:IS1 family transposase n=1 Tax=Salinibacter ruber TaxID=146919 RepID=UPI0016228CB3|nr:IS1 family transposase [Salinibacter ruber]MBB4090317.1 transposase-like protein [Salinibacter ruber]
MDKESFLPDEADCAETWRQPRWPEEGPECPDCGSTEIQTRQKNRRNCFHRYCCRSCGRWFTDTTDTFLEASGARLSRWVYLIREMDKKCSINDIAKDLDLMYKTVLGMSRKVKEAIYDRREEWLDALTGKVEADDVHVKGG